MKFDVSQIASQKIIGKLKTFSVREITTKGGYKIVLVDNPQGPEIAGCGSHRAIGRFIAKKRNPDIEFTELSKSEEQDLATFEQFIPAWELFTDKLIATSKK